VGAASDQHGRRRFIIAGLIFLVPTTLAQGLVVTSMQMIIARLLQGISGAMVFAPALALAGDLARQGQSGAQLSVLTVAFGLGISFGQLAAGFLIRYGFVTPFLFGTLIAGIGAVLVYTQVEEAVSRELIGIRDSSLP
jgi:MFS family permease